MSTKKTPGYKYELSWLTLAKAFWNEKILTVVVASILTAVSVAVIHRLPAVYKADALVLVDTQKIPERFVSTTVTAEVQDRLTTISQEILSSTRLNKIISDFNLYAEQRKTHVQEEILEMMRRDLDVKVERPGGGNRPGAFRISFQGPDPTIVAQVTNRIANLYIEENLRTREVQAEGTSEFIENQLQEGKKQLDQLEDSVSAYKRLHNGELPQQETALTGTLSRLQTELSGAQDAISRAEQNKILLQNSLAGSESTEAALVRALQPVPASSPAGDVASIPVVARPVSRVDQLTARLRTLRVRYSDEHPEVKETIRELERAREAERREGSVEERNASTASATNGPKQIHIDSAERTTLLVQLQQARERTSSLRAQLNVLDREIEARQADRRRILREISGYQSRIERLPLREQEMAALTRDYEISKTNYRSLLEKKIAAEMASDLERRQKAEKFTILDPARVPEKPAKPNRPVLYAASMLGSLVLGIALAIGKGLMHNKLLGEWELPKDVTILGRVPYIELAPTMAAGPGSGRTATARRWKFAFFSLLLIAAIGGTAVWVGGIFQG